MAGSAGHRLIAVGALLAACTGHAARPVNLDPAAEWLAKQYYGTDVGKVHVHLPHSVSGAIYPWVWSAPGERPLATTEPDLARHYWGDVVTFGSWAAQPFKAGRENVIVDRLIQDHQRTIAAIPSSARFDLLNLHLVPSDAMPGVGRAVAASPVTVRYRALACLVVEQSDPGGGRRSTNVLVGGGPGWSLNDASTERCILAGLVTAYGMVPAQVLASSGQLYPRRTGSAPCSIAQLGAGTIDRDYLKCRTRVRLAWPFALLKSAAGPNGFDANMDRAAFTHMLTEAARRETPRRTVIERREQAALDLGLQVGPQSPPTCTDCR